MLDTKILVKHQYWRLGKADKGLVTRYLMKVTGYSHAQIKRLVQRIKAAFGRSAMDFLKELRLQRAAHLLRQTRRPVKSIADHVGFDSRSHFIYSFADF